MTKEVIVQTETSQYKGAVHVILYPDGIMHSTPSYVVGRVCEPTGFWTEVARVTVKTDDLLLAKAKEVEDIVTRELRNVANRDFTKTRQTLQELGYK